MKNQIAMSMHGTLSGIPYGTAKPDGKYVYQTVAPGLGNDPSDPSLTQQIRRHVIPHDPKTHAQLAQREKMRAAMTAWRDLDAGEIAAWRERAKAKKTTGFHLYVSLHLSGKI